MDISYILQLIRPECRWHIENNDYNKLQWFSETSLKPTLEEIKNAWNEIVRVTSMNMLREERDVLLRNSDKYTSISDWPFKDGVQKESWIIYRQKLRDLPANASPSLDDDGKLIGVEWPTPPC